MENKIYTAQEMRVEAKCFESRGGSIVIAAMLSQAAEMRERLDELLLTFHSCPDERDLLNYILHGNPEKDGK